MPMLRVIEQTMQLILEQKCLAIGSHPLRSTLRTAANIPVDDDLALSIAKERRRGECDDDVASRLVRAITGESGFSGQHASCTRLPVVVDRWLVDRRSAVHLDASNWKTVIARKAPDLGQSRVQ